MLHRPCVGGLSVVNAIDTRLRDLMKSGLTLSMMMVEGIDGRRRGKLEEGEKPRE